MNRSPKDQPPPVHGAEPSTDTRCLPCLDVVQEVTALFDRVGKRHEQYCLFLPQWLHHVRTKGQPDWSACALLGEVLYWHRANSAGKKKFAGSRWHANTRELAEKFGLRPESVRRVFYRLNKLGLIHRELRFRNDAGHRGRYVYVTPIVDRVFEITFGNPPPDVGPKAEGVSASTSDVSARSDGRERPSPPGVGVVTNTSVPNKSPEQAPTQAPVPPSAVRSCVPSPSAQEGAPSKEELQRRGLVKFWSMAHRALNGTKYKSKEEDEEALKAHFSEILEACHYDRIPLMMYWALSMGKPTRRGSYNEYHFCGLARRHGLSVFCKHYGDIDLELGQDIPNWVRAEVGEIYAEAKAQAAARVT